ncbi:hypothetical protein [Legionella micdadei]|uniref:Uncharacterized protein n=1 Tax=Legionella micdadei TaxID=451 RepID=A0A098GC82_LEGMI|nr:hypothetical protein [Legionella micdadei]ARG96373.1 hypothetical protein B6N58_00995 [Legionella micdadei]ARG99122.1 hypothetical protein B6V88_00985 [Legionella micdadei]KTD29543.1 hypothetical protein Lmic_0615 [Legionella micdadei]CEG59575.1 protein of unknown function [Legionella micdadei]SCX94147.1 hypothetical protein SAMN02982997_00443 [Legionella micdadei]
MTASFNQIIGIKEDANWKDIVRAYDKKMEELVNNISHYDTRGVNPEENPQIKEWTSKLIQLTNEIRKILTQRIDNAVALLEEKIDSLEAEITNASDELFVKNKSNKKEKIAELKRNLESIKANLNSADEENQIDYGRACEEIQCAALNARTGLEDHTGGFCKFINWILSVIGISSVKIKTDTENQIDAAEKTIYDSISPLK